MVDEDGHMLGGLYGIVPWQWAPHQQARDGEDYAFYRLASLFVGAIDVYCDCKGTIGCAVSKPRAMHWGNGRREPVGPLVARDRGLRSVGAQGQGPHLVGCC